MKILNELPSTISLYDIERKGPYNFLTKISLSSLLCDTLDADILFVKMKTPPYFIATVSCPLYDKRPSLVYERCSGEIKVECRLEHADDFRASEPRYEITCSVPARCDICHQRFSPAQIVAMQNKARDQMTEAAIRTEERKVEG